jgi:NAD+ kinase
VPYTKIFRGERAHYEQYTLVITVGGDGTFLQTANHLQHQCILGVNSATQFSVGKLCAANVKNFETIFNKIKDGRFKIIPLYRLNLQLKRQRKEINALNDVLVCHQNPAVMCRYAIKIKGFEEEHRSSGVWVSTAVGSTGAIRSAGGKPIAAQLKRMQYLPRELYAYRKGQYRLKGGVLSQSFQITSLMRFGMIYVDGANLKFHFPYGEVLKISLSNPIQTIRV